MVLRGEPLCRRCGEAASQVDHIVPLRKGGTNSEENLQSLCHSCHSRKTITEDM
jgi:5-methylcytosine-specific restriction protein A